MVFSGEVYGGQSRTSRNAFEAAGLRSRTQALQSSELKLITRFLFGDMISGFQPVGMCWSAEKSACRAPEKHTRDEPAA